MRDLKRITTINFIILFISFVFVSIFMKTTSRTGYIYVEMALYLSIIIFIHFLVNFILSIKIFSKNEETKEKGKVYLLNSILILAVGFPSCLYNARIIGF